MSTNDKENQYPNPYADREYTQKGLYSIKWSPGRLADTPGVKKEFIKGSDGEYRYFYKDLEILTTWKQMYAALTALYKSLPPTTGWISFSHAIRQKYLNVRSRTAMEFLYAQPDYQRFAPLSNISHSKAITSNRAGQRLGIDLAFMGDKKSSVPSEGGSYVCFFACVDYFSKRAWVYPMRDETQDSAIKCMKKVLDEIKDETEGQVRVNVVQCDRGPSFGNGETISKFVQFCKDYYEDDTHPLRVQFSRAHTPSTNGLVERFNGTFKRALASYTRSHHNGNLNFWPKYIKPVLKSYNAGFHRMLKGKTPLEVFKGDITPEQKEDIEVHAEETNKKRFVSRVYSESRELKPGDKVRISLRRVSEEVELGNAQGGAEGARRAAKDVSKAKGKPGVEEWSVKSKSLKKSIMQTFSDRTFTIKGKVGRTYRLEERKGAYDRTDLQSAPTLDMQKWNSDAFIGEKKRYNLKRKRDEGKEDDEQKT